MLDAKCPICRCQIEAHRIAVLQAELRELQAAHRQETETNRAQKKEEDDTKAADLEAKKLEERVWREQREQEAFELQPVVVIENYLENIKVLRHQMGPLGASECRIMGKKKAVAVFASLEKAGKACDSLRSRYAGDSIRIATFSDHKSLNLGGLLGGSGVTAGAGGGVGGVRAGGGESGVMACPDTHMSPAVGGDVAFGGNRETRKVIGGSQRVSSGDNEVGGGRRERGKEGRRVAQIVCTESESRYAENEGGGEGARDNACNGGLMEGGGERPPGGGQGRGHRERERRRGMRVEGGGGGVIPLECAGVTNEVSEHKAMVNRRDAVSRGRGRGRGGRGRGNGEGLGEGNVSFLSAHRSQVMCV